MKRSLPLQELRLTCQRERAHQVAQLLLSSVAIPPLFPRRSVELRPRNNEAPLFASNRRHTRRRLCRQRQGRRFQARIRECSLCCITLILGSPNVSSQPQYVSNVQGVPSGHTLSFVDLDFYCCTVIPTLPWPVGVRQKRPASMLRL